MFETERPFHLPRGFTAADGKFHHQGVMRVALAADEIILLEDPRVKANRAYLVILLLSRVIIRLGDLEGADITPALVERLYAADLAYLQGLYREINGLSEAPRESRCPHCGEVFRS